MSVRRTIIAYHEIDHSKVATVQEEGLKCTSRGTKGDDALIIETDALLDEVIPADLRKAHVSRDNNLYALMKHEKTIVRITDGKLIEHKVFINASDQAVLELSLDVLRCYVSDLDAYDQLKSMIHDNAAPADIDQIARTYWQRLIPLASYKPLSIRRPEIMVTYDIPPDDIQILTQ